MTKSDFHNRPQIVLGARWLHNGVGIIVILIQCFRSTCSTKANLWPCLNYKNWGTLDHVFRKSKYSRKWTSASATYTTAVNAGSHCGCTAIAEGENNNKYLTAGVENILDCKIIFYCILCTLVILTRKCEGRNCFFLERRTLSF